MATFNISLTPELAALINEKVSSGMYHSANEVVRERLRLVEERDETRRLSLQELKREVAVGTSQIESGEYTTYASGKEVAAKIKAAGRKLVADRVEAGK